MARAPADERPGLGSAARERWASGVLSADLKRGVGDAWRRSVSFPGEVAAGWLAGAVAFRTSLAALGGVAKSLRLSSSLPLVAPLYGACAVAFSSVLAARVFVETADGMFALSGARGASPFGGSAPSLDFVSPVLHGRAPGRRTEDESLFYAAGAVLWMTALRGRLSSVCPSDLFKRGPFGKRSLAAAQDEYATASERAYLLRVGRRDGCHHCGTRLAREYIGDHIPPNKLANGAPQELFAQCGRCSQLQAAAVRADKRTLVLSRAVRLWHVWPPLPIAWMVFAPAVDGVMRAAAKR